MGQDQNYYSISEESNSFAVSNTRGAFKKLFCYLAGLLLFAAFIILIVITDSTLEILKVPGGLILLGFGLVLIFNVILIIYFKSSGKKYFQYFACGTLTGEVLFMSLLILAAIFLSTTFGNILGTPRF